MLNLWPACQLVRQTNTSDYKDQYVTRMEGKSSTKWPACQLARQTNTTDYRDQEVTHMDQETKLLQYTDKLTTTSDITQAS